MGEVHKLVQPDLRRKLPNALDQLKCTCGQSVSRCRVWGPFSAVVAERPELSHASSYRELLNAFYDCHGSDQILSDSSKYLPNLEFLVWHAEEIGLSRESLAVLHLVRDARGFVSSQKRLGGKGFVNMLRYFRRWYVRNLEMERFLEREGIRFLQVGYEEISMSPESTMNRIADFLGISFEPTMLMPSSANGHLVIGNPMRKDARKSSGVFYDNRWFTDQSINLLYDVLPRVSSVNRRMVYRNTIFKTGK